MRSRASTAQSAIAISATTTVIGLLRAARTRRMWVKSSSKRGAFRQPPPDGRGSDRSRDRQGAFAPNMLLREDSSACLPDEGLNIAGGRGHAEQAAPDGEPGQRVVDLGLREQALRLRDFRDGAETRLIPRRRLLHISEPTRLGMISYAVFCLKKK